MKNPICNPLPLDKLIRVQGFLDEKPICKSGIILPVAILCHLPPPPRERSMRKRNDKWLRIHLMNESTWKRAWHRAHWLNPTLDNLLRLSPRPLASSEMAWLSVLAYLRSKLSKAYITVSTFSWPLGEFLKPKKQSSFVEEHWSNSCEHLCLLIIYYSQLWLSDFGFAHGSSWIMVSHY